MIFLDSKIWRPAAAGMQRLKFTAKMGLISAVFLLPVMWLLVVHGISKRSELDFIAQERAGVRYGKVVFDALDAAAQWRYLARSAALGDGVSGAQEAQNRFFQDLERLKALDQELGSRFNTTSTLQSVVQSSQVAKEAAANPAALFPAMNALTTALAKLQDKVTDGSLLALDPVLETYHLVNATMVMTPDLLRDVGELRGLGRTALLQGEMPPEASGRFQGLLGAVEQQRVRLVQHMAKVKASPSVDAKRLRHEGEAALEEMLSSIRKTFPPGGRPSAGQ